MMNAVMLSVVEGHHDTQHNDIQFNDTQHKYVDSLINKYVALHK
jgi:hypothetical protein